MRRTLTSRRSQGGLFLLEALVSILIFSLGILGLVAMGSTAIASQSDVQFRNEAAALASDIASSMQINVDPVAFPGSLTNYQHLETEDPANLCSFSGTASTDAAVTAWQARVAAALPGASAGSTSIRTETAAGQNNRIVVTVCWKPPVRDSGVTTANSWRRYQLISYVNQV